MTYNISISGSAASAKGEAEVLAALADFVEAVAAEGSFGFTGSHLSVSAAPTADAAAAARSAVATYNAGADSDDQASQP